MIAEIVAFVVLLAAVAVFGAFAWRLTLHLIGFEQQELTRWTNRLRDGRAQLRGGLREAAEPMPATATAAGVAERVDRVLARLDDVR